jgi:hypothetical protein
VLTEKEKMEDVVNQITFGSRNSICGHLLGRKPIPFYLTFRVCQFEQAGQVNIKSNQLKPYLSILSSFDNKKPLSDAYEACGEDARISD